MIVLKQKGNLVFSVPVINNSVLEQLEGKCLLNDSAAEKDYFKRVSLQEFDYEGREYTVAQNRVAWLKTNTDYNDGSSFYDFKNKKAYLYEYVYEPEKLKISEFNLLRSNITEFFISGLDFRKQRLVTDNMDFDISTLINLDKNSEEEINSILSLQNKEIVKDILYKLYPEFATFYYEIYPYMTLEQIESYDIDKLKELRIATESLKVNTCCIDQLLNYLPKAENNVKVLNLLKR